MILVKALQYPNAGINCTIIAADGGGAITLVGACTASILLVVVLTLAVLISVLVIADTARIFNIELSA